MMNNCRYFETSLSFRDFVKVQNFQLLKFSRNIKLPKYLKDSIKHNKIIQFLKNCLFNDCLIFLR